MEGLELVLSGAALVVAIVALVLVWSASRADARGPSPAVARAADLERHLAQLGRRVDALQADLDAAGGEVASGGRLTATPLPRGTAAISRIGLVRFDAFEDTGGAQSFSLALVDDGGDGIVLTSLHSRPTTRVYLKAIRRGVADAPLSAEETRALQDAGITPVV
jgi:Protein of unknown function (DUF4446)